MIDDVSSKRQLQNIQKLNLKLTPAIFPPSKLSWKSHLLAQNLTHFLVHLPMESSTPKFNKQYKTIMRSWTAKQMQERAKALRKLFPSARYINNHTGSRFTANYSAMKRLYIALDKENFNFIDSRTIGSTKVPKISKEFGDRYLGNDIFLDNIHTIKTIHIQLRQAVKIAKKQGYALAIGHPHRITLKALKSAKHILKGVELVYVDALYEEMK